MPCFVCGVAAVVRRNRRDREQVADRNLDNFSAILAVGEPVSSPDTGT